MSTSLIAIILHNADCTQSDFIFGQLARSKINFLFDTPKRTKMNFQFPSELESRRRNTLFFLFLFLSFASQSPVFTLQSKFARECYHECNRHVWGEPPACMLVFNEIRVSLNPWYMATFTCVFPYRAHPRDKVPRTFSFDTQANISNRTIVVRAVGCGTPPGLR